MTETPTARGSRDARAPDPDLPMRDALEPLLPGRDPALLHPFAELGSTFTEALRLARGGAPSGTVVLAGRQTAGIGRLGRDFFSPDGAGVYLSYLVRPRGEARGLSLLTSYAGLAVAEELEALGLRPGIKWPNDLMLGRRKVCGILTKLTNDAAGVSVNGAVLGIGINVRENRGDFPEALRNRAISVREAGADIPRDVLTASLIRRLDRYFLEERLLDAPDPARLAELKRRSCVLGRRVTVLRPGGSCEGVAEDLAEGGGLIVRRDDGSREILSGGEVSVRGADGSVAGF